MNNIVDNLETGDIILYDSRCWYSKLIEYFTNSPYSHISIVLKKPVWLDEKLTEDYYLLESGGENFTDSETGKMVFGVQIVSFNKVYKQYCDEGYGKLYYRKLDTSIDKIIIQNKIKDAYFKIQCKPYDIDPFDWIMAYYELDRNIINNKYLIKKYQNVNKFWCSALVSYIYVECELLDKNIPWTIVSPSEFSYKYLKLPLINCKLENDKLLI